MSARLVRSIALLALLSVFACIKGPPRRRDESGQLFLVQAEQDMADGRVEEGLRFFAAAREALGPKDKEIVAFVKKHEVPLLAEADRRAKAKQLGAAYLIARRVSTLFGSGSGGAKAKEYGAAWSAELRAGAEAATTAGHPGKELIFRAALAAMSGDAAGAREATRAAAALRDRHRLAVKVQARGDAAKLSARLSEDPRFDASGSGAADTVHLALDLTPVANRTDVQTTTETVAVESGTQAVANPDYAVAQDEVARHEEQLEYLHDQRQMEEQSPSRSEESLYMFDYQISVEQEDLERAREVLGQTPSMVTEPVYVDRAYPVEIHTLSVERIVDVNARFASGGTPFARKETARVTRTDKAHEASRELGLARDPVQLPSPQTLAGELDAAVAAALGALLDGVYGAYRERLLAGGDRGEGLALYLALAPESVDAKVIAEIETALDVPEADRLLAAIAENRLATAFDDTRASAPAPAPASASASASASSAAVAAAPTARKPSPTVKPQPARTPVDSMAGKGRALAITAFELRRGDKAIVSVDKTGVVQAGRAQLGVWNKSGEMIDKTGAVTYAIDKQGDVWIRTTPPSKYATWRKGTITMTNGATVRFDELGHVVITAGKRVKVSEETIVPAKAAKSELALLVVLISYGKLRFKDK